MIDTGPDEPNLRVVDVLVTEDDDREMHFTVLVVEAVGYEALGGWLKLPPSPALVIPVVRPFHVQISENSVCLHRH